ncbi:MAG: hypothetical protein CM1200mP39_00680 [Dehalococcoidia bacterium]|nr:MAG: hypothetical protein CM1200mP39_00680 [Dehalococcoidia bacterium]
MRLGKAVQRLARFEAQAGGPGKWFEPHAGTYPGIEVVETVRRAVGDDIKILVDANNGYEAALIFFKICRGITDSVSCGWKRWSLRMLQISKAKGLAG